MSIILEILYLATLSFQLLRSIESNVCFACIKQLFNVLFVNLSTLTLSIRAMIAAETNAFIKLNSKPTE